MKNTRKMLISILFIVVSTTLIISCQRRTVDEEDQIQTTDTFVHNTNISPSLTPIPIYHTQTVTHLPKRFFSPTITETQGPTLTPTPSATIRIPFQYDFPQWLKDPLTTVVMSFTDIIDGEYQLSFFGEQVDQRVDIMIPPNIQGYFWIANQHFGLLAKEASLIYSVDLSSGLVTPYPVKEEIIQNIYLENDHTLNSLIISSNDLEGNAYILISVGEREDYSPNWKFKINRIFHDYESTQYEVINLTTGEKIPFPTSDVYFSNFSHHWVQNTPSVMAIFQTDVYPDIDQTQVNMNLCASNKMRLILFNFETGETINLFEDKIPSLNISPDKSTFLYFDPCDLVMDKEIPCLYTVSTQETQCLKDLLQLSIPSVATRGYLGRLTWSNDSTSLYYNLEYYTNNQGHGGNLCKYNISTKAISCPTNGALNYPDEVVILYRISPNEKFVALYIDRPGLGSDAAENPHVAIVGMDGTNFRWVLTNENNSYEYDWYRSITYLIWRPLAE